MMCTRTYIAEWFFSGTGVRTATPALSALFLGILLLFPVSARAVELRLEGDRLWLQAQEASLTDLMRGFAHAGVRVQMDPTLRGLVTVHIDDTDIEQALADLFESIGYVLIWDVVEGPLGQWPKLAEIQLFMPGQREQMQPLSAPESFVVMSMQDGSGIEYIADEIVIGFAPGSDKDAIRVLIREIGGTVVESLPELGIYRIRLPPGVNVPALVEQLARNALVAEVEPNYAYRMPTPTIVPDRREARAPVPVARPREGATPIAVLDSGLTMLPDMEGLIVGGFNALHPDRPPTDTAGHGTQMALIGTGAIPPYGMEGGSGVPVLPIRAFDDNGVTSNFAQMQSLFYAADQGAKVLNMSWGSPANSAFLDSAIAKATAADFIVVASAGNEPLNKPMYPAAYPDVIAVSASVDDDTPWPQSNYGDFIFLAAPGTASFPIGYQGEPGSYAGTSIASAAVSHALGLYFDKYPKATAQQAKDALQKAVSAGGQEWNPKLGHGVLNQQALDRLLN